MDIKLEHLFAEDRTRQELAIITGARKLSSWDAAMVTLANNSLMHFEDLTLPSVCYYILIKLSVAFIFCFVIINIDIWLQVDQIWIWRLTIFMSAMLALFIVSGYCDVWKHRMCKMPTESFPSYRKDDRFGVQSYHFFFFYRHWPWA